MKHSSLYGHQGKLRPLLRADSTWCNKGITRGTSIEGAKGIEAMRHVVYTQDILQVINSPIRYITNQ